MSQIKILHMADVHFGRPSSGLPKNLRDIRRQEVRSSFSTAINLASEKNVDAVLIAGDLFDNSESDKSTINFVAGELLKIPHIPVFIAPGNHDPIGSAYSELIGKCCPNLTVFGKECSVKHFEKFAVYGIGFGDEVVTEPLIKKIKADNDEKVNIAVVHGELATGSIYNPITESDIADTEMNYVALGHVHTYSGIKKAANTFYAYSGALEGGGFDECGAKGVILAEVSKSQCRGELVTLSRRQYHIAEIDVTDTSVLQEIIDKAKASVCNKENLYKIVLTGKRPEKIPDQVIENELDAFFVKIEDNTRGIYDLEDISKDYTIEGIFAKKVLARMENADQKEKERLLKAADVFFDILTHQLK